MCDMMCAYVCVMWQGVFDIMQPSDVPHLDRGGAGKPVRGPATSGIGGGGGRKVRSETGLQSPF